MLLDRVKCAVPNPGAVSVGSTITLGAAPVGFRSFLTAFGGAASFYFVLSDAAGRAITGVWTVNATGPETATITEILWNDRLNSTAGETFSVACVAWNAMPARETVLMRTGPLAGFRNLIINGNPLVNQRFYASGQATIAANQYTLDRWRVVTSGQAVTFTDSLGVRTVTAPAGGMEQVIEGLSNLGGVHTLNWTGTATATVGGGAVAKGAQFTLTGNDGVTVRMTGGTWSQLQLEPGNQATPFERRPIGVEFLLCQRYYEIGVAVVGYAAYTVNTIHYSPVSIVRKRVSPTVVQSSARLVNVSSCTAVASSQTSLYIDLQATAAGNCAATSTWTASAEL